MDIKHAALCGSGTKTPRHIPPTKKPGQKPTKTKKPRQKSPRLKLCVSFLKKFMVSQVHNLLIVQWLPIYPLVGWWFLKTPFGLA